MRSPVALSLLAVLASLGLVREAAADLPVGSAALLIGGGLEADGSCGDDARTCPFGLGVGLRGGLRLPRLPVYLGGTLVQHFGHVEDRPGGDTRKAIGFYPGIEAGYELKFSRVVLRPYVGLGILFTQDQAFATTTTGQFTTLDVHHRSALFWPGLTALVNIDAFFFGLDFRWLLSTENTPALMATFGVQF